jgi:hypothetical protein
MMFIPHRKHTYGPPRPVKGVVLLLIFTYIENYSRIYSICISRMVEDAGMSNREKRQV